MIIVDNIADIGYISSVVTHHKGANQMQRRKKKQTWEQKAKETGINIAILKATKPAKVERVRGIMI